MTIEEIQNGIYKLTSENGILDIRTQTVYSEVIVQAKNLKYFTENDEKTQK